MAGLVGDKHCVKFPYLILAIALAAASSCKKSPTAVQTKSIAAITHVSHGLLGESTENPRMNPRSKTIDAWSKHADAAIMHVSVPYKSILGGVSATTYVNNRGPSARQLLSRKRLSTHDHR